MGSPRSPGSPTLLRPIKPRSLDERFKTKLTRLSGRRGSGSHLRSSSAASSSLSLVSDNPRVPSSTFSGSGLDDDELIRWTKLRRISSQVYGESATASHGRPVACLAISSGVLVGTSEGLVLVFDHLQNLRNVLKPAADTVGASTPSFGAVSCLCASSDQTFVGAGYTSGHVLTWALARPTTVNMHVVPATAEELNRADVHPRHRQGVRIVQLCFTSERHGSLVSGDEYGTVLSHKAIRTLVGLKSVASKTVMAGGSGSAAMETARHRPQATLALTSLPQIAPELGLVAVLTPYTMVLVSTMGNPQTQFKASRSKNLDPSTGFSGTMCFKQTASRSGKLAYAWSNIVQLVKLNSRYDHVSETSTISVHGRRKFVAPESVVSVQFLSGQVLCLITVTQRMLILNEATLTVSASADLINKHVMHHDLYSRALHSLTINNGAPAVVADSYASTLCTYNGRVFVLGNYEFVAGSLVSWTDRLMDKMDRGDYSQAIQLATNYYLGLEDVVLVGLSADNDAERHLALSKTLPDMITSSLRYVLKRTVPGPDQLVAVTSVLGVSFEAIVLTQIDSSGSVLSELYEALEQTPFVSVFFDMVINHVSTGDITFLPPALFKDLVNFLSNDVSGDEQESTDRLEEVICSLDTDTLDVDFSLAVCRRLGLWDAQVYIWNNALMDFISPLTQFVELMTTTDHEWTEASEKVYPYLSYILTGRTYPTGLFFLDSYTAFKAKCHMYYFIFSGTLLEWPKNSGHIVHTDHDELPFPYLSQLIMVNSSSFFAALNEALEDSFLNDSDDTSYASSYHDNEEVLFGSSINRQFILNILVETVFTPGPGAAMFDYQSRLMLSIFIARNYPKYSQFLMLPGKLLSEVLQNLCYCSVPEFLDSCALAIIALLSNYKPPDLAGLIATLTEVKMYTVLIFIYRSERQYDRLLYLALKAHFEDASLDQLDVLNVVQECLVNSATESKSQQAAVYRTLLDYFEVLTMQDLDRMVSLVSAHAPSLHSAVFALPEKIQFRYLDKLFSLLSPTSPLPDMKTRHLYMSLLIKYGDHESLWRLLNTTLTHSDDVNLAMLVDDLVEFKYIDVLALLLRRQNRIAESMIYVIDHLLYVHEEYKESGEEPKITSLEHELSHYTNIGIDLCQAPEALDQIAVSSKGTNGEQEKETVSEQIWTRLMEVLVDLARTEPGEQYTRKSDFTCRLLSGAFSSLLSVTSRVDKSYNRTALKIFRTVLEPTKRTGQSRTVGAVRPILDDLFSAYRYQYQLLLVAREILDHDSFEDLMNLIKERVRGWTVARSGECESCGRKIIRLGIDADWVYEQWEARQKQRPKPKHNGKGKGLQLPDDVLVVFKCEHSYHLGCLRNLGQAEDRLECIVDG